MAYGSKKSSGGGGKGQLKKSPFKDAIIKKGGRS